MFCVADAYQFCGMLCADYPPHAQTSFLPHSSMSPSIQDQKAQAKTTSQHLMNIFKFLEQTLLRGRAEKREQKQSKKKVPSNISEAMQGREVAVKTAK